MVKTDTQIEEQIRAIFSGDTPWVTIVWDDPVNLMTYVTYVLMELFGFSKEKAHELMMKVGHEDPLAAMVGITSHDAPPEDEVLHRLLPNAYQDQVDSAEFRRYTESTLRNKKQAHAMAMRMYLKSAKDGTVDLDHDSANAWLGAVNDIRLALGVRLNVQERTSDELELLAPDDPLRGVYIVYGWLGWLQEGLLAALMDES